MKNTLFIFLFLLVLSCNPAKNQPLLESPSKNLKVQVDLIEGKISYQVVSLNGASEKVLIKTSSLGVIREEGNFAGNLSFSEISKVSQISESYTMLWGKQKDFSYTANEANVRVKNPVGQSMDIVFRLFDEGLAFRYVFPETSGSLVKVISERTGFTLNEGIDVWMAHYQQAASWGDSGYEANYIAVKAGDPSPSGVGWTFPLLFKDENQWIFISESGLEANYCASRIGQEILGGQYTIAFPNADERNGDGQVDPESNLSWEMPWRFIQVEKSLEDVVESSFVQNLAQPSKIEGTSSIKPGRASWEWWYSWGGRTVKNLKEFLDLSEIMGWEYLLVEACWGNMPDGTIEELFEYAKAKNVGILLWYSSGWRRNENVSNSDFVVFNDDTRDAELARIAAMEIKGIKVDFFATDKQLAIDLYLKILRDAAKHKLLVNFHGNTLPRGRDRTWPNLLTMGAERGAEAYRFSEEYPDYAATYNTLAAVTGGAVTLKGLDSKNAELVWRANEKGVYLGKEQMLMQAIFSADDLAWINSQLIFRNEPLDQVVGKLENWYGVNFRILGKRAEVFRLSGEFEIETLKKRVGRA